MLDELFSRIADGEKFTREQILEHIDYEFAEAGRNIYSKLKALPDNTYAFHPVTDKARMLIVWYFILHALYDAFSEETNNSRIMDAIGVYCAATDNVRFRLNGNLDFCPWAEKLRAFDWTEYLKED